MSPESATFTKAHPGHQANALSSTARHLTQREFPGSDEVFQKIKALIGGKNTENIPQIQRLLEEMQTAYSKRISNLLSNIQSGSIRIRDAHQEVQQMLHEIRVFKENDMPEEVAAVTEAITSMCNQISKKVQAVRELIDEVPVVAHAVITPVEPAKTAAAVAAPAVATPVAAPEIDQPKEQPLSAWIREIYDNTHKESLTRSLLLAIAEISAKGETTTKKDLATRFEVEERVIVYTLGNWKREHMQLSFTLRTNQPYVIYSKDTEAPVENVPKPRAVAAKRDESEPARILDIDDAKIGQWLEAVRANSKVGTATQKALEHIVKTCKTGTTWEALMGVTGQETPRLVYDCLRAWLYDKKRRLPFTLEIKLLSGIKISEKGSMTDDTVESPVKPPKAPIVTDKIDINPEQKAQWLQYVHEHTRTEKVREDATGYGKTRMALTHIIENYQTGITWKELAAITKSITAFAIYDCVRAWMSRNENAPFQLQMTNEKVEISPRNEATTATPPRVADTTPAPAETIPVAPVPHVPPLATKAIPTINIAPEISTAPIEWLNAINSITSPDTSNRRILVHMANNHEKEVSWEEILQISGEEVEIRQMKKRIERWREKLADNTSFEIITSDSGAKMVPKGTPEVITPSQTPVAATAATMSAAAATTTAPQPVVPPEVPLSETETSGHQGKAMIYISKMPLSRMVEKVAYEALASKFGTEVTREELTSVETAYNRDKRLGRIDMVSLMYRLSNDRISFNEMPFTIVKTEKGFKMMQKETRKAPTAEPLPETTPEQARKEKAMRWFNDLNLNNSMIIYGFLKKLAENPSVKISDRKILEDARKMNPKITADDLYTLFSDSKKKGRIKAATYPMSNYTLDVEAKSAKTDNADKYFFKLHEVRL